MSWISQPITYLPVPGEEDEMRWSIRVGVGRLDLSDWSIFKDIFLLM